MSDDTRIEMKLLREQIAHDLTVTWKTMGQMDDRVNALSLAVQQMAADMSEGFRQCQGRLRLVEQRVGTFLGLVEQELSRKADQGTVDALADRVTVLEQRLSA